MADLIKLTIDGREIEVEPGTLILEAAKKLGIEIPTFCYDNRLKSVGACRMCLVEVEKSPKLVASCATPVGPGMVVKTNSEKVIVARRGVLEFLLINHPLDCPTCDKGGECPLQNLTIKYGPAISRYGEDKIRFQDDLNMKFDDIRLGPEIWMNKNRCIICYKCIRIARDLAGGTDLGIFQRNAMAKVDIPSELMYINEFSGNTVEYCPVGALMSDSFRYKIRNWLLKSESSVSWVCPDGANITVQHNQGKIWRHYSRQNDNVEMGFLSDKDRYSFDITSHPDRILQPLGKNSGLLEKITYDDAIARMVHRIREEKPENWGLLLDTTLTNEEAYCASEYFGRNFPGSAIGIISELDIGNDIPASSLGLAVPMTELEKSDLFIVIGCDIAAEHPILSLRLKKALKNGSSVYFIDSRKMYLGRFEVNNIIAEYGKEDLTLNKIADLKNGRVNNLPDTTINKLNTDLGKAKNIHILGGYDLLSSPIRGRYYNAVRKLTESLNAKLSLLTTETNYLGIRTVGQPNVSFVKLIEKIENGEIKTLFIAGGDPVNVFPDRERITKALAKLDYLIYWGAFRNASTEHAALIYPSLLPTENAGSYLNIERRLQLLKKPYQHVRLVTSLIKLLTDIKIETDDDLLYYSPEEVFENISLNISEFKGLKYNVSEGAILPYSGISKLSNDSIMETAPAQYPFALTFGRSVYYGASGITEKSSTLKKLIPPQKLVIHSNVAGHAGYETGQRILLETANGEKGQFELVASSDIEPGILFLFGYSQDNPPNKFMAGYNTPVYAKISKV